MKIGLFSPYIETIGGGERYLLTIAEMLLQKGNTVDLFWDNINDLSQIEKRLNINLKGAALVENIFNGRINKIKRISTTAKYDVIIYLSDGSIPVSFAKKTILHFQRPFIINGRTLANKLKLKKITDIVCNSIFTKEYVDKSYGVKSSVIYPPVDIDSFSPAKIKENIILSVGRFFAPSNPKKQEIMIREFANLSRRGLKGWKFILIGGVFPGMEKEVDRLRKKSSGYPIKIIANGDFKTLQDYYAKAKIYWHAAGYGEDLEKSPDKAEHFGISTVEAMSAGCIPIVFAGGGQKEIITDGINGLFWQSTEQLIEKTFDLINSPAKNKTISEAAIIRSQDFSKQKFYESWEKLLN